MLSSGQTINAMNHHNIIGITQREYHLMVLKRYTHALCGLMKFQPWLLTVPAHVHSNYALNIAYN